MSKRFLIQWTEEVSNNCSVEIEAEDEKEALQKWNDGEYEDYVRDEASNKFDEGSESAEEIED